MPPKREKSFTMKLSEEEILLLKKIASSKKMDASELGRACIALALPVIVHVSFARGVQLEDNNMFNESQ